jgi:hypothetical protein
LQNWWLGFSLAIIRLKLNLPEVKEELGKAAQYPICGNATERAILLGKVRCTLTCHKEKKGVKSLSI